MNTTQATSVAPPRNWVLWTGRVLSGLVVLALAMSASMKLSHQPAMVEMFTGKFGYPLAALNVIAVVEIACALLYAFPRTAVLGAALVTAYLGGAVATHVRVGDPFAVPVLLGVFAWVGLYLREPRLRPLAPLREDASRA